MQTEKLVECFHVKCYGLNVSLQNSYVEPLSPNVLVVEGGAFFKANQD